MYDIKFRYYKDLYVADSSIAGTGLYTAEPILAGETILSFGGVLARLEDRYSGKYMRSTSAGLTESILICEESSSTKDFSDYINHSCDPNVGFDDCLTIIAIKDISPNTELTYDYAFCELDEDWKLKELCNCQSSKCRHSITGKDWRLFTSNSLFFHYSSPFIKRRIISNEKKA